MTCCGTMSKLVIVLLPLLLSKVIVGPPLTSATITYYVSPTSQSCPQVSAPCHSLDNYVANSSEFFSSEEDVTLIFVNGTHTSSCGKFKVRGLTHYDRRIPKYSH